MIRRTLVALVLVELAWPTVAAADDDPAPPPTTVVPPDTTAPPDTTVPPATTVPAPVPAEEPPPPVEAEARSMTVAPHLNLVHDELVHVRGSGWPSNAGLGAAQCAGGVGDISGCGPIHYFSSGPLGNFNTTMRVDVILDTQAGTFDCRVVSCVIGANDTTAPDGAQVVTLTFDPSGPDPVRRTATVEPDTDLVDGQRVLVTGEDFSVLDPFFGGYAQLVQCVGDPSAVTCDNGTYSEGRVSPAGRLRTHIDLFTIVVTDADGTYDCRTGGCTLAVQDYDEGLAEAASVPLGFDPSGPVAPPPTLAIEPATDLADGDLVEATGSGWEPESFVLLVQCVPGANDFSDCDLRSNGYGQVDENGELEGYLGVRTHMRTETGGLTDCRTGGCVLLAAPYERLGRGVEAPLAFDPNGRVLHPRLDASPSTGLHDGDEIRLRGTEFRPGQGVIVAQCLSTADRVEDCDLNRLTFLDSPLPVESAGTSVRAWTTVHRVIHLAGLRTVNCRRRHCAMVVIDNLFDGSHGPAPRVGLGFAPET